VKRSIFLSLIMTALALSAGCQCCNRDKDDDHAEASKAKLAVADLPADVRKGFDRDFPGAKIVEAEKETYADGTIHYEIEYKTSDGKDADVEYSASGEQLDKH
jgi:uncharacterized membrane protein YkoI